MNRCHDPKAKQTNKTEDIWKDNAGVTFGQQGEVPRAETIKQPAIFTIKMSRICPDCHGSGEVTGTCSDCEGQGEHAGGPCGNCHGTGQAGTDCPTCDGTGSVDD
ncbi:hypothetical protein PAPYR_5989 [Paratrimastix pyriformis]|uniref:Molecular chaperone DnaJ n=1 Tax=Paratrimastix pyriformis TaxID=342808 RepID=A0ABQ8UGD5_9EUKA|nr:hypothetical protein PAPYR_5989 [Paratrimastix pyriformis]